MMYTLEDMGRDLRTYLTEIEKSKGKLHAKDYENAMDTIFNKMAERLNVGDGVRLGVLGFMKPELHKARIVKSNLPNVKTKSLRYPPYIAPVLTFSKKIYDILNKDIKTISV